MKPVYLENLPDESLKSKIRNPFRSKILIRQFDACLNCFDIRHKDLIATDRRDGRFYQHRGNAWAHHFWIGYNGQKDRLHYRDSYDTPAYACWKAGNEIRKLLEKESVNEGMLQNL